MWSLLDQRQMWQFLQITSKDLVGPSKYPVRCILLFPFYEDLDWVVRCNESQRG